MRGAFFENKHCGVSIFEENTSGILPSNHQAKEGDKVAEIFRSALNLEDANILAKKYRGSTYSDHYYDEKEDLLVNLIGLCREGEDILYGYQYTDDDYAYINAVMYFDLPGCEQISFHCHLETAEAETLPKYPKEWDGQRNSTLPKLEKAILARYGEEIAEL
ncbi:MAG: hypothetical protein IJP93_04405 [Bacteroidales bacterium]|nr:hypothetical protein [Bacteroidales bacterium]